MSVEIKAGEKQVWVMECRSTIFGLSVCRAIVWYNDLRKNVISQTCLVI